MNNNKLIAQDWWLKPSMVPTSVWCFEKDINGGYFSDYKNIGRDLRLIGTKKQINDWFKESDVEVKDIWDTELTEHYKELYKENGKKLLILNLI